MTSELNYLLRLELGQLIVNLLHAKTKKSDKPIVHRHAHRQTQSNINSRFSKMLKTGKVSFSEPKFLYKNLQETLKYFSFAFRSSSENIGGRS